MKRAFVSICELCTNFETIRLLRPWPTALDANREMKPTLGAKLPPAKPESEDIAKYEIARAGAA